MTKIVLTASCGLDCFNCRMKLIGIEKWTEEATEIRKRYYEGKFIVGKGPVLEND